MFREGREGGREAGQLFYYGLSQSFMPHSWTGRALHDIIHKDREIQDTFTCKRFCH